MSSRRGATALAGVLPIDKPSGMTSHDVIDALRRATGERRIGHAGTLDPMATGLLLVLLGRATRLEQYLIGHDKTYEARIVFGTATDTLDADGAVTETAPVPEPVLDPAFARRVLDGFLGRQEQMPPAFSAIKRDGVAAYRLARAGEDPRLSARPIVVHRAELTALDSADCAWEVTFEVSKGTYIRSLAADIGTAASTVAHLGALRRTRIGSTGIERAVPLTSAIEAAGEGRLDALLVDPVPLLEMVAVRVTPGEIADGRSFPAGDVDVDQQGSVAAVTDDELLGVYRRKGDRFAPETVFVPGIPR